MILSFAVAFWRYRRNTLARSRNRSTTPYTTPAMSQTYPYRNGFGRSGRGSPFGGAGGGRLSYPAPTYGTGQTNVAPEWDPTAGFAPVRVVLCTQVANRSRVFAVLMLYYCFVNSRRCPPPHLRGMANTASVAPPQYSSRPATYGLPREKEEV